jgi:hypothetical protein
MRVAIVDAHAHRAACKLLNPCSSCGGPRPKEQQRREPYAPNFKPNLTWVNIAVASPGDVTALRLLMGAGRSGDDDVGTSGVTTNPLRCTAAQRCRNTRQPHDERAALAEAVAARLHAPAVTLNETTDDRESYSQASSDAA